MTYMIYGMELATELEYQDLVLHVYSDIIERHLLAICGLVFRDVKDFAPWCLVAFAYQRLGYKIREG